MNRCADREHELRCLLEEGERLCFGGFHGLALFFERFPGAFFRKSCARFANLFVRQIQELDHIGVLEDAGDIAMTLSHRW